MNSSVQSSRRIASNRLWTPAGVVCDPLVEVAPDGGILSVERCPDPDRLPFTEFHAGMLVPGFPADYRAAFAWLLARRENSLAELLPQLLSGAFAPAGATGTAGTASPAGTTSPAGAALPAGLASPPTPPVPTFPTALTTPDTPVIPAAPGSCLVVLSGLDYDLLRLTAQSQIRLLARF